MFHPLAGMARRRILVTISFAALFAGVTCGAFADDVDYLRDIKPILARKCFSCHGVLKQESSLRLDTVALMKKGGDSGAVLKPGDPEESVIWQRVSAKDEFERMPPKGEPLTEAQLLLMKRWIESGAAAPPDEQPLADPNHHWAFQPLKPVALPHVGAGNVQPIDAFIRKRLNEAGLNPSAQADGVTLVRRMFLDLHGLPPTPAEIATWVPRVETKDGVRELIDHLLASPRYGERIAQHWLDLVRYADTHGFEVNTPRPNAWPYRDYVIQAFNDDKPYDQFVKEQLAGDQLDADPATGFLVAAAVLLPGQIGKDDASIRLARQDSLDEIIVGTSATFLGLTLGCTRCHDHKFDPFTQQDYYGLQAFFAGVEYGDREIHDEDYQQRLAAARKLSPQIEALAEELESFQPTAFTGRTLIIDDEDLDRVSILKKKNGHGTNPDGTQRGYKDDPGDAGRVPNLSRARYTWWDNVPGEDVFTWNPDSAGRFRVWISWGVHGSGVHTRDARYVLDEDGDLTTTGDQREIAQADQFYYSGQTAGESEKTPRWSGLADAGVHEFRESTRLVLRGGKTGTGITADVIVLQEVVSGSDSETSLPRLRGPVDPLRNVESFPPVESRFVRFTSFATNESDRYEPCLDELEVFTAGDEPINVAAASRGTKPTSSGNYSNTGRHQLKHINDEQYGNGRSWISNEKGRGWVQLEFPEAATINKVIWARDREGKYQDRLPVDYIIETSLDGETWTTVAGSGDRVPQGTPHDETLLLARNSPAGSQQTVTAALEQLTQLRAQKTELEQPRMVYAGLFRQPDETFLLNRGDPEQPQDRVQPHVPAILSDVSLSLDAGDSARRLRLAEWMSDRTNPLTARVMVNRLWQMHFGTGLVETPSDFGMNGARPSHPQLLDWLANEFIASGWSVKHMHRLMMSTDTYQQSSKIDSEAQTLDADCRLLWRFPSRRLEAEAIRDGMLLVSGELNLQMGGPGFDFFKTRGGLSGFPPVEEFGADRLRRMIYAHKIRMEQVPVFGAFDCPDAGQPTPSRSQSTTAIQALNLFNSEFVYDRAEALAQRIVAEAGHDIDRQVESAFLRMLGRQPNPAERDASRAAVEQHGLATLARVLLNSNEFLFLP